MELSPTKFADFSGGLNHGPVREGTGQRSKVLALLVGNWLVEMAKLRARDVDCCRTSKPHPLLDSCHAAMSRAISRSTLLLTGRVLYRYRGRRHRVWRLKQ